jgi:hypothetical protein
MGEPKTTDGPKYVCPPELVPELQEAMADDGDPLTPEQFEAHLRWLETGEGEPWPPERST